MQARILRPLSAVTAAITIAAVAAACSNAPPRFTNLAQPPDSVEGRSATELVSRLMRQWDGERACSSRSGTIQSVHADFAGYLAPIPSDFSLEDFVPVGLLRVVESGGDPFTAYRFHWIEEWRIVMWAPPPGNLRGSLDNPKVIEVILIGVSEPEQSTNDASHQPEFIWAIENEATLFNCKPA